ncbi:hypothetical protein BofuT4_P050700.1 [Botrytis cinerea T4]|uniref:Uncharacterized protein n=1 Tax=Botryotinia fuckeliana (strain T4) TaxID=999810 RepID=G2XWX4_BOTF4|nr:hypothetical protein BofuT4_P050700.1 [Botrytis cinerea T4]
MPDPRVIPISFEDATQVCQSAISVPISLHPIKLPTQRFEIFVNSIQNLEKLDAIAMIPGLVKSIFGPHPRPCPDLCNTFVEKMPNLTHLLSANCTRERDELPIGMSGYLMGYKTIGTKVCSDLSLSIKSYALDEDTQRRTDNFRRFWNINWCQAYLELHGLPLVLVKEKDLEVGEFWSRMDWLINGGTDALTGEHIISEMNMLDVWKKNCRQR